MIFEKFDNLNGEVWCSLCKLGMNINFSQNIIILENLTYNPYQILSISTSTKGIVMHRTIKEAMFRPFKRLNKFNIFQHHTLFSHIAAVQFMITLLIVNSDSGQDEPNPVLCLAAQDYLLCPARKISSKPLLTKPFSQDGWMLAWHFFCEFNNLGSISENIHVKKTWPISSYLGLTVGQ